MFHAVALALVWPAVAAHELAHWLAARGAVEGDELHLTGPRPRYDVVAWAEGAALRIVLVAYAPVLIGLGIGLLWTLALGIPDPETTAEWCILALGMGWYAVFILPSESDLRTAQEGFDRAQ
jgi:hypothetical protein